MYFSCAHGPPGVPSEVSCYAKYEEENNDECEHDDVMAYTRPNLQPATIISDQKEKLQCHEVGHYQDQQE